MERIIVIIILFFISQGCNGRVTGYESGKETGYDNVLDYKIIDGETDIEIEENDFGINDVYYTDEYESDTIQCEEYRCESFFEVKENIYMDRDSGNLYMLEYSPDKMIFSKYNKDGVILWNKEIIGIGECLRLEYVDKDENFYISQDKRDCIPKLGCSCAYKHILYKYKKSGNGYEETFKVALPRPDLGDRVSSIALDEDGNLYVIGNFVADVDFGGGKVLVNREHCKLTGNPNAPVKCFTDIFVAKYNRDGNILWAKGIGGEGDEGSESIYISNEGLILSVYAESEDIYIDENKMTMKNGYVMIVKLDKNGVYKWSKIMAERSGVTGGAGLGGTDREGNMYIYGYFDLPSNYSETDESKGLIIAKYDQNGGFIWGRKFEGIQRKDVVLKDLDVNNIFISNDSVVTLGNIYVLDAQGHFTELHGKFLSKYNISGDRIWYREFWDDKYSYSIKDIEGYYNGTLYLLFSIMPGYTKVFDNCVIISSTNQNDFLLRFVSEQCSSVEADK